jgi:hypothetical protein
LMKNRSSSLKTSENGTWWNMDDKKKKFWKRMRSYLQ